MPLPLRKPFFLKGRTSVVQRAVIMSVVLGGLACGGGWLVAIAILFSLELSQDELTHVLCVVWTVAAASAVYGPLNHWNRRSILWTIIAAPVSYASIFAFQQLLETGGTQLGLLRTTLLYVVFALVSGLPLVRKRRLHALAYATSVVAASVASLSAHSTRDADWLANLGIPDEIVFLLRIAAWFSVWLCSFAIPWGIPFWWPPEKDAGAEASSP